MHRNRTFSYTLHNNEQRSNKVYVNNNNSIKGSSNNNVNITNSISGNNHDNHNIIYGRDIAVGLTSSSTIAQILPHNNNIMPSFRYIHNIQSGVTVNDNHRNKDFIKSNINNYNNNSINRNFINYDNKYNNNNDDSEKNISVSSPYLNTSNNNITDNTSYKSLSNKSANNNPSSPADNDNTATLSKLNNKTTSFSKTSLAPSLASSCSSDVINMTVSPRSSPGVHKRSCRYNKTEKEKVSEMLYDHNQVTSLTPGTFNAKKRGKSQQTLHFNENFEKEDKKADKIDKNDIETYNNGRRKKHHQHSHNYSHHSLSHIHHRHRVNDINDNNNKNDRNDGATVSGLASDVDKETRNSFRVKGSTRKLVKTLNDDITKTFTDDKNIINNDEANKSNNTAFSSIVNRQSLAQDNNTTCVLSSSISRVSKKIAAKDQNLIDDNNDNNNKIKKNIKEDDKESGKLTGSDDIKRFSNYNYPNYNKKNDNNNDNITGNEMNVGHIVDKFDKENETNEKADDYDIEDYYYNCYYDYKYESGFPLQPPPLYSTMSSASSSFLPINDNSTIVSSKKSFKGTSSNRTFSFTNHNSNNNDKNSDVFYSERTTTGDNDKLKKAKMRDINSTHDASRDLINEKNKLNNDTRGTNNHGFQQKGHEVNNIRNVNYHDYPHSLENKPESNLSSKRANCDTSIVEANDNIDNNKLNKNNRYSNSDYRFCDTNEFSGSEAPVVRVKPEQLSQVEIDRRYQRVQRFQDELISLSGFAYTTRDNDNFTSDYRTGTDLDLGYLRGTEKERDVYRSDYGEDVHEFFDKYGDLTDDTCFDFEDEFNNYKYHHGDYVHRDDNTDRKGLFVLPEGEQGFKGEFREASYLTQTSSYHDLLPISKDEIEGNEVDVIGEDKDRGSDVNRGRAGEPFSSSKQSVDHRTLNVEEGSRYLSSDKYDRVPSEEREGEGGGEDRYYNTVMGELNGVLSLSAERRRRQRQSRLTQEEIGVPISSSSPPYSSYSSPYLYDAFSYRRLQMYCQRAALVTKQRLLLSRRVEIITRQAKSSLLCLVGEEYNSDEEEELDLALNASRSTRSLPFSSSYPFIHFIKNPVSLGHLVRSKREVSGVATPISQSPPGLSRYRGSQSKSPSSPPLSGVPFSFSTTTPSPPSFSATNTSFNTSSNTSSGVKSTQFDDTSKTSISLLLSVAANEALSAGLLEVDGYWGQPSEEKGTRAGVESFSGNNSNKNNNKTTAVVPEVNPLTSNLDHRSQMHDEFVQNLINSKRKPPPPLQHAFSPPEDLLCQVCDEVATDPVVTQTCGHFYCSSCIVKASILNKPECPMCRLRVSIPRPMLLGIIPQILLLTPHSTSHHFSSSYSLLTSSPSDVTRKSHQKAIILKNFLTTLPFFKSYFSQFRYSTLLPLSESLLAKTTTEAVTTLRRTFAFDDSCDDNCVIIDGKSTDNTLISNTDPKLDTVKEGGVNEGVSELSETSKEHTSGIESVTMSTETLTNELSTVENVTVTNQMAPSTATADICTSDDNSTKAPAITSAVASLAFLHPIEQFQSEAVNLGSGNNNSGIIATAIYDSQNLTTIDDVDNYVNSLIFDYYFSSITANNDDSSINNVNINTDSGISNFFSINDDENIGISDIIDIHNTYQNVLSLFYDDMDVMNNYNMSNNFNNSANYIVENNNERSNTDGISNNYSSLLAGNANSNTSDFIFTRNDNYNYNNLYYNFNDNYNYYRNFNTAGMDELFNYYNNTDNIVSSVKNEDNTNIVRRDIRAQRRINALRVYCKCCCNYICGSYDKKIKDFSSNSFIWRGELSPSFSTFSPIASFNNTKNNNNNNDNTIAATYHISTCPYVPVFCPYKRFGCRCRIVSRKILKKKQNQNQGQCESLSDDKKDNNNLFIEEDSNKREKNIIFKEKNRSKRGNDDKDTDNLDEDETVEEVSNSFLSAFLDLMSVEKAVIAVKVTRITKKIIQIQNNACWPSTADHGSKPALEPLSVNSMKTPLSSATSNNKALEYFSDCADAFFNKFENNISLKMDTSTSNKKMSPDKIDNDYTLGLEGVFPRMLLHQHLIEYERYHNILFCSAAVKQMKQNLCIIKNDAIVLRNTMCSSINMLSKELTRLICNFLFLSELIDCHIYNKNSYEIPTSSNKNEMAAESSSTFLGNNLKISAEIILSNISKLSLNAPLFSDISPEGAKQKEKISVNETKLVDTSVNENIDVINNNRNDKNDNKSRKTNDKADAQFKNEKKSAVILTANNNSNNSDNNEKEILNDNSIHFPGTQYIMSPVVEVKEKNYHNNITSNKIVYFVWSIKNFDRYINFILNSNFNDKNANNLINSQVNCHQKKQRLSQNSCRRDFFSRNDNIISLEPLYSERFEAFNYNWYLGMDFDAKASTAGVYLFADNHDKRVDFSLYIYIQQYLQKLPPSLLKNRKNIERENKETKNNNINGTKSNVIVTPAITHVVRDWAKDYKGKGWGPLKFIDIISIAAVVDKKDNNIEDKKRVNFNNTSDDKDNNLEDELFNRFSLIQAISVPTASASNEDNGNAENFLIVSPGNEEKRKKRRNFLDGHPKGDFFKDKYSLNCFYEKENLKLSNSNDDHNKNFCENKDKGKNDNDILSRFFGNGEALLVNGCICIGLSIESLPYE